MPYDYDSVEIKDIPDISDSDFEGCNVSENGVSIHKSSLLTQSIIAIDLLKHMLVVDPSKRFSAAQAAQHKWFTEEAEAEPEIGKKRQRSRSRSSTPPALRAKRNQKN